MKLNRSVSRFALGAVLLGASAWNTFAAEETLRDLAKERGRYIGAILNSEWFRGDIEPEFEQIHKTQFNTVVAENEMKFDATEPSEGQFNYTYGARAMGRPDTLRTECRSADIGLSVQDAVIVDGDVVSSTYVREMIATGNMEMTAKQIIF